MKTAKVSNLFLLLLRRKHTMSTIYRPAKVVKSPGSKVSSSGASGATSESQRLLIEEGLIAQSSCPGAFHLLPLGLRSLDKLVRLLDTFMEGVGGQKIQMPTLTSERLWRASGRLGDVPEPELMSLADRHQKRFLLSPTHEESVCQLISSSPLSYRQLPLRMYQITEKFRDEKRPRYGLMRGREFLMKDMYTFDVSEDKARETYQEVVGAYEKFFQALDLPCVKAIGTTGTIGGKESHEFHLISRVGEDTLIHCESCNTHFNGELMQEEVVEEKLEALASTNSSKSQTPVGKTGNSSCISCGSNNLSSATSIEVGHAFLLGTKYSNPLSVNYVDSSNASVPVEMGCFGVGVSRLLAAIVEVSAVQNEMRWSPLIAPFFLSVIPPKAGSKEEKFKPQVYDPFMKTVSRLFHNDLVEDDRLDQTVGKRLQEAKRLGIPYIALFGKSLLTSSGPLVEIQDLRKGAVHHLSTTDAIKFLYDSRDATTHSLIKEDNSF